MRIPFLRPRYTGRHRPGRLSALARSVLAVILTGLAAFTGIAVANVSTATFASAAVDNGRNYSGFPYTMRLWINYWAYRGWPTVRSSFTETDYMSPRRLRVIGGLRYNDEDRQLANWIRANFREAQTPVFYEYDMRFRDESVHGMGSRGVQRIVRDAVNGFVFYTDDHYRNFHLFEMGQNWPNEDSQDRTPPPPPPPPAAVAWIRPNDTDVAGERRYILNAPTVTIPANAGTRNAANLENRVANRTDADDVGDYNSAHRFNMRTEVNCGLMGTCAIRSRPRDEL